jgi:flavodoxin I
MIKTAIFFSPEGGSVHQVAMKLGEMIGSDSVVVIPVNQAEKEDVLNYDQLIFAGSTVGADHWSNETIENEWTAFFKKIADVSLKDKKAAIVGLGNSVLYPEHFADGMAHLYKELSERGARIYGAVGADDYTFEDSEALNENGMFRGLPLDEDNEDDLSPGRIQNWLSLLKPDFGF